MLAHHKKPEKTTDILKRHHCFPAKLQAHTKPAIFMCDLVHLIALKYIMLPMDNDTKQVEISKTPFKYVDHSFKNFYTHVKKNLTTNITHLKM